jgi:hypothetical protein
VAPNRGGAFQQVGISEDNERVKDCHPPDGSTSSKYKQLCFKLP